MPDSPLAARAEYPESLADTKDHLAAETPVDTLYYDGQCPLCATEIGQLRENRGAALNLVDIHALPDDNALPSKDSLLRTLHLRRGNGDWLTGADANVAAWEGTRHGRVLTILRWPVLRHGVDLAYALWARWRYRRLYARQG